MTREPWLKAGMAAVVTGGSSGIGRRIAERLAAEGVGVASLSRSGGIGDAPRGGGEIFPVSCDVREPESVTAAVEAAYGHFGRIDVLVNAAGVSMPEFRDLETLDVELWRRIVDTNLTGLFLTTRAVMPHLKSRGGYIVNILSTAAHRSIAGNVPYSASKYGARAVSETAVLEGKAAGVRVASISPGPVNTNIWSHKTVPPDAARRETMLDPEDIADAALFLLKTPSYVMIGDITITPFGF